MSRARPISANSAIQPRFGTGGVLIIAWIIHVVRINAREDQQGADLVNPATLGTWEDSHRESSLVPPILLCMDTVAVHAVNYLYGIVNRKK